jgi:hypothetical protein
MSPLVGSTKHVLRYLARRQPFSVSLEMGKYGEVDWDRTLEGLVRVLDKILAAST